MNSSMLHRLSFEQNNQLNDEQLGHKLHHQSSQESSQLYCFFSRFCSCYSRSLIAVAIPSFCSSILAIFSLSSLAIAGNPISSNVISDNATSSQLLFANPTASNLYLEQFAIRSKFLPIATTKNEADKGMDTTALFDLATSLSIMQGVNLTNQQYDLLYQSFDQIHQQAAEITSIEQRLAFVNTLRANQGLDSAVTAMNLSDSQEYELDSLLQIFAFQVMGILTPEQVQTIFDNIDQSGL